MVYDIKRLFTILYRLFELASARFRAALATFPLSVGTLYQWAYMLTRIAARSENNQEKSKWYKEAEEVSISIKSCLYGDESKKLRYVLEIEPEYIEAKITLTKLLYNYGCLLIDNLKSGIF